jgi:rRNA-processing protein EBP2
MVVVGEHNVNPILDINDDLARETAFYERALASAEVAVGKLKALGVAVRRPDDFYAEMVKSDEHMKRVRAELIFEQTSMETKDERRKAREQKRYGKQVQAEKLKERTLQKKESISKLDKFRKQRKRDGFEDNGKAPDGFEEEGPEKKKRQTGGGGSTDEARPKPGIKRISRRTSLDSGGGSGYVFFFFRRREIWG